MDERDQIAIDIPTRSVADTKPVGSALVLRRLVRSLISHQQASHLGDAVARHVPHRFQRALERKLDFPVGAVVRSSHLLLIRVPKTASVSLALQVYGQVSHVPHRTAAFYRNADPAFFARTTSFAVVRDPWERALSAYRWLRGRGNDLAAPDRRGRASVARFDRFEQFVFEMLLPAAEAGCLDDLDPVLHPQWRYVCDAAGRIIVDRVFHLERMDEIQAFLAANGVSGREIRANTSERATDGRRRERDAPAEVLAALGRVYAHDAALFGYGPPAPDLEHP